MVQTALRTLFVCFDKKVPEQSFASPSQAEAGRHEGTVRRWFNTRRALKLVIKWKAVLLHNMR
jgi:hypothetical protein